MFIGFDVGGHSVRMAVVDFTDDGYRLVSDTSVATPLDENCSVMDVLFRAASNYFSSYDVSGIGIGVPAFIESKSNRVVNCPNIPNFPEYPVDLFRDFLVERFPACADIPVVMENDANCAAVGEGLCGSARDVSDFCVVTLGTGVGCGIFTNGSLLRGYHGMAGEIGHLPVASFGKRCSCGGAEHLECVFPPKFLCDDSDVDVFNFRDVWSHRNDEVVHAVLDGSLDCLARSIVSLFLLLDCECVVLSGGISHAEGLVDIICERMEVYLPRHLRSRADVRVSSLGDDVGAIGAACLCWL